jgi:rhodanese-related sulfurtransferase
LPGELTVYPGHDYAGRTHSTLAQERDTNALLRLTERDRFIAALRAGRQPKPANMDAIVAANIRASTLASCHCRGAGGCFGGAAAPLVVDVRLPAEYRAVHPSPASAAARPNYQTSDELPEIARWCSSAVRARAVAWLQRNSLDCARVLEGLRRVAGAGHPVVEGKAHEPRTSGPIAAVALAGAGGVPAVAVSLCSASSRICGRGSRVRQITDRCGMAMLLGKLFNRGGEGPERARRP